MPGGSVKRRCSAQRGVQATAEGLHPVHCEGVRMAGLRSRRVAHCLLELNQQLDELGDVEYFAASASLLAVLIPGDPVAWNEVNLTDQSATVLGREGARREQQPTDLAERVARTGLDHPAIRSYFADPKDAAPI
jgi:hypothetical protein